MATLMQNILFISGQARYGLAWLILDVQAERGRSVHLALNLIGRSLYKKAAAAQRFTS